MAPALPAIDRRDGATPNVAVDPGLHRARLMVFTTLFPNSAQPRLGVFVRDRVAAVATYCPTQVVAPVLRRPGRGRLDQATAAAVPLHEQQGSLQVHHPRFATCPGLARFADGVLLFLQALPQVRRLHDEFPFNLIDAHYAFPDGMAAVLMGRRFRLPVCVTVRGGDIDLLPRFRMRRKMIRWTLQRADRVFAVSHHLATGAAALGAQPERLRIVPNGVDTSRFAPTDRNAARRCLGISEQRTLVLCVANLTPEKGHHVLIEAFARLDAGREGAAQLFIIGSDQWGKLSYQRLLERRITELGLADRVRMIGAKPQGELPTWYSAADLVVLPTFREGCPNVVREALACGAPVIASRVGGVPELLASEDLGVLVEPGDPSRLADAIRNALRRNWDRAAIATVGGQREWRSVGLVIASELKTLVTDAQGRVGR